MRRRKELWFVWRHIISPAMQSSADSSRVFLLKVGGFGCMFGEHLNQNPAFQDVTGCCFDFSSAYEARYTRLLAESEDCELAAKPRATAAYTRHLQYWIAWLCSFSLLGLL